MGAGAIGSCICLWEVVPSGLASLPAVRDGVQRWASLGEP